MSQEPEVISEEVVAKYKKLLSLARSSLESNQANLAAKDKQINQLMVALEEERSHRLRKSSSNTKQDDEMAAMPRNLLKRVDMETSIWILIEYEGLEDNWKCFASEQELEDFIQRVPGVPLIKPPRCLTPSESHEIVITNHTCAFTLLFFLSLV